MAPVDGEVQTNKTPVVVESESREEAEAIITKAPVTEASQEVEAARILAVMFEEVSHTNAKASLVEEITNAEASSVKEAMVETPVVVTSATESLESGGAVTVTVEIHRDSEVTNTASEGEQDSLLTPGQVLNVPLDDNDNDIDDIMYFDTAELMAEAMVTDILDKQTFITQDFQDHSYSQEPPKRNESVKRIIESSAEEDNNNNILDSATKMKISDKTHFKPIKQQKLDEPSIEGTSGATSVSREMNEET